MSDQNIKKFFIIVFATSFFSLAVALYVEYVLSFKPCILCIYQRIPYAIALLISLIAFFKGNKKTLLVILGLTFMASVLLSVSCLHFAFDFTSARRPSVPLVLLL